MTTQTTMYRAFRFFLLLIVSSAVILLATSANAATYNVYGGTKAFWPDGSWMPVPSLGDPDDGETERLDFVGATTPGGDATNYAFYTYTDGTYAYFRLRVDQGTYVANTWADAIWIMIDGDANNTPDYALAWDSKGKDGLVTHDLEFQVISAIAVGWGGTRFDDIDMDAGAKLTNFTTCTGGCWYVDIPYTPWTYNATRWYAGYLRVVDNQPTTTWGTTMLIDIAVSWDYLIDASTAAHSQNSNLPVLSPFTSWKLQAGSLANSTDHNAISTDVAGNSNPNDPMVWSDPLSLSTNNPPVNAVPGTQTVRELVQTSIAGVSVTDADGNLASTRLQVTGGVLNVTLQGAATISAGANNSAGLTISGSQTDINNTLATLKYTASDGTTIDTLTMTSTDTAAATDSDTFTINVQDPPVNTVPGTQAVTSGVPTAISGVSVTDTNGNLATTQLTVGAGSLNVSLAGGASISAGANNSTTLTLSGTEAQINAALATLQFTGVTDTSLTMLSTDGTALTDSDSFAIIMVGVNVPPVNTVPGTQTVTENLQTAIIGVSVTDTNGNLSSNRLQVTGGVLNVTLTGTATISAGANNSADLTISGSQADINATLATLKYTANNGTTSDTVTMTSTDDTALTDVDNFAINVNNYPVNTVPGSQTILPGVQTLISGLSVTDRNDNLSTSQLTVGAGSLNLSLAGGATISAGANDSATLTLSGTEAQINAALATLKFTGSADTTLTMLSMDDTALTDNDTVSILMTTVGVTGAVAIAASTPSGQPVTLSVTDADLNTNPGVAETVTVTVFNTRTGEIETVTLTETGNDTDLFTGSLQTTDAPGGGVNPAVGVMNTQAGDLLEAHYVDALDALGNVNQNRDADGDITAGLIDAVDDAFTVNSATGGVTASVFNNDTLAGHPFAPGDVTAIIPIGGDGGIGVTINSDGTLNVPAIASPLPSYTVTYQICDKEIPTPNCDTAFVTITVLATPTQAIAGTVYNDLGGDGKDTSDPGINGVSVLLYASDNTTLLWSTVTAPDGTYVFSGIADDDYVVKEVDPSGYISITLNEVSVMVSGATSIADFGDQQVVKPARRAIQCVSTCTACNSECTPEPQYVTIDGTNPSLDLTTTGSIEAWIQATSCTVSDVDAAIVIRGASAATAYGFGLAGGSLFDNGTTTPDGTAQNIGFRVGDDVLVANGRTLTPGKWYHVACVWDSGGNAAVADAPGATMAIYINGVLEKYTSTAAATVPVGDSDLIFGRQTITATPGQYFGIVEEFRLWNTARAKTDIRDNMCKGLSVIPAELACYLQFNEVEGTVAVDASGNSNDVNTSHVSKVCSEAPVGDDSDYDYYDFAAAYLVSISAGTDTLTAEPFSGTWSTGAKSGIHIYRVENVPEPSNGPMGSKLFGSRGYWGVFVTGVVDAADPSYQEPTYQVTYAYGPAGIGDENNLQLFYRHQGCAPWIDSGVIPDISAHELNQTDLSGTEFILGKNVDPRNVIDFDGTNDVVTVPDSGLSDILDIGATGTLEAWIYIDNHTANGGIIHKGDAADQSDEAYSLTLGAGSNTIVFNVRNAGGVDSITYATPLNSDTWYHVAGVWDDAVTNSMQIYINGVLVQTGASARTARDSAGDLNIGSQFNTGGSPFDGYIDEVRTWSAALTQAQIQANMCRKLLGTEVGLAGYWRFDEETADVTCPDYAGSKDATMTNFTTGTFPIETARICSSAPVGDYSASNYASGTSNATLNPTATGGSFQATATITGGAWPANSGIHVYRLDEAPVYGPDLWVEDLLLGHTVPPYGYQSPNGLTPPTGWSSIDYYRYFGVFVTDPTAGLTYNTVYNYTTNPMTPDDDSVVRLARRPSYCYRTWSDTGVLPNTAANTLTFEDTQNAALVPPDTGSKQNPEYIFGGEDAPLAITLASFAATAADGCVDIEWETATEINTAGFHVWRSDNPLTGFVRINSDLIPSKSVMETMGAKYAFRDCGVDFSSGAKYYYMLEEIEIDGAASGNMNGPIGPVSETISAAQSTGGANDKNCFIDSLSWW